MDAELRLRLASAIVIEGPKACGKTSTAAPVAAIDEAGETPWRFADRIDTKKCRGPALLAVIMGNGLRSVRPDAVAVIPISCVER